MPPSTVCATTASVGSNRDEATRAPPVPTGTSSRLTGSFHPMFLVVHLLLLSSLLLVSSFVGASSSRRPSRPSRWKTSGTSPSKSSKLAWWSSAMIPHRTTQRTTQHFYTRTTPRETPPSFSSLSSLSSLSSSSSSRDTKTNKDDRRLWRAWWWEYKDAKRERERFFGRGGGGPERARKKALGFLGTHPPPQMCCPCNERECLFLGFSVSYKTLNNREKKKKKKVGIL